MCYGIPRYGSANHIEAGLYTFTQLQRLRYRPADRSKPDGHYFDPYHHKWIDLFKLDQAIPMRPLTEKQRAGMTKGWETTREKYKCTKCGSRPDNLHELTQFREYGGLCEECHWRAEELAELEAYDAMITQDRVQAVAWARERVEQQDFVILDTETTSLNGYIVEIGVIDPAGRILFHSLLNPQIPITAVARSIHGITDEEAAQAPKLIEVWEPLLAALTSKPIVIAYNVAFDELRLRFDIKRYKIPRPALDWQCLMEAYAEYCGDYSDYFESYKWQRLPGAGHRVIEDCQASLKLLRAIAIDQEQEQESYAE